MEGSQRDLSSNSESILFWNPLYYVSICTCYFVSYTTWTELDKKALPTFAGHFAGIWRCTRGCTFLCFLLMRTRNHKECVENCFCHSARANFLMDLIIIHSDLTTTIPRSLSLLTYWKSLSDDHVTYASLSLSFNTLSYLTFTFNLPLCRWPCQYPFWRVSMCSSYWW